jgi:hypothetical protein
VYGQMLEDDQRSWREFAAAEPIRIPGCARPLFAAHLAYRRASGAAGSDPYFEHPRAPGTNPRQSACARRSGAPRGEWAWTCPGCTAMTAGTAPTSA